MDSKASKPGPWKIIQVLGNGTTDKKSVAIRFSKKFGKSNFGWSLFKTPLHFHPFKGWEMAKWPQTITVTSHTLVPTHTHALTESEWERERERERERIVQQFLSNQIFLVQPGWQTLGPTGGRNVGFVLVRNFESFLDLKGGRMDRMANEISRTKYQQPRTRFFPRKKEKSSFFSSLR